MSPIRVGLVGTGYAAKARAASLAADSRAELMTVAGRTIEQAQEFGNQYGAAATADWTDILHRPDLDLIVISTINCDHAKVAKAALEAGKHVVVEYPLALEFAEAVALKQLAQQQNRLLHVEHIELLSGNHLAVKAALVKVGIPFYARFTNLNAQRPAPEKWTYAATQFGFPLIGALSRIQRLTDLFGQVSSLSCEAQYWVAGKSYGMGSKGAGSRGSGSKVNRYQACLCTAQLQFVSGLIVDLVYGKGETFWQSGRKLEIHAEQGGIFIDGEQGTLVQADQTQTLDLGSRRGLFAQDTTRVLDYLTTSRPLYVSLDQSLYALQVADAARRSAEIGETIQLAENQLA